HRHHVRGRFILPRLLRLRRRGGALMLDEPEGYRIPLRTSLTRPPLIAGDPRTSAIMHATVASAIGFCLQQPITGIPLGAIAHSAGAYASSRDPWFLDTWPRAMAKPSYFGA